MYKRFVKRLLDITFSIIILPFFIPIFIILVPIIYFEDRGSVFYSADRLGRNGKVFKMYKFRSMKMNAPDLRNPDGSTYNSINDPRVTKIGKIMRKTSLDELPQLLNVLRGDMSLVGFRPDLPEDIHIYTVHQRKKLNVRPGITGYSQAYFRNSISQEDKFNNDVYYAEKLSFAFDIKILFKTIITVLKKENVFKSMEEVEFQEAGKKQAIY